MRTILSLCVLLVLSVVGMRAGLVDAGVGATCDGWTNKAGVCVPASILEADFSAYQAGLPPPVEVLGSQLRAANQAREELLASWHVCEANLSQTTTAERKQITEKGQEDMLKRLEAATPKGMQWDKAQGRYVEVPKTPEAPKKGG